MCDKSGYVSTFLAEQNLMEAPLEVNLTEKNYCHLGLVKAPSLLESGGVLE